MPLPIRTLPILEHWDCQQCGQCCRGSLVRLDEEDLERLREQRWEDQPDFRGVRTVASHGIVSEDAYARAEAGWELRLLDGRGALPNS